MSAAPPPSPPSPPSSSSSTAALCVLPPELIALVAQYLCTRDALSLALTQHRLHGILNDTIYARVIRTEINGYWPLWWAVSPSAPVEAIHTARRALRLGADPEAHIGGVFDDGPFQGRTPLFDAVGEQHVEMVHLLLQYGADPRASGRGCSPLTFAAQQGDEPDHINILKLLIHGPSSSSTQSLSLPQSPLVTKMAATARIVNTRDGNGNTPLHIAAARGHDNAVRLLLQAGAKVDAQAIMGKTPLHAAISAGNISTATTLLDAGADLLAVTSQKQQGQGENGLDLALRAVTHADNVQSQERAVALLRLLLMRRQRMRADGKTWLDLPPDRAHQLLWPLWNRINSEQVLKLLLESGIPADPRCHDATTTPLWCYAGRYYNTEDTASQITKPEHNARIVAAVRLLIEAGADVNFREGTLGFTPLLSSVVTENTMLFSLLISRGADVDAKDNEGSSLLHTAVQHATESIDVLRILLPAEPTHYKLEKAMRGQLNALHPTFGRTPLLTAIAAGNKAATAFLLCRGASLDISTNGGHSALAMAMVRRATVLLGPDLLSHGANLEERDADNYTPLMFAAWRGCSEGIDFLLNRGAEIDAVRERRVPETAEIRQETALSIAIGRGMMAAAERLLRYGADYSFVRGGEPRLVEKCRNLGYTAMADLLERMDVPIMELRSTRHSFEGPRRLT